VPQTVLLGNDADTTVQFNLQPGTSGYKFPSSSTYGISITDKSGVTYAKGHDANDEFDSYSRVSDTEVTVNDKNDNTSSKDYCYCVTVTGPNGESLSSDPIIRNRGG
jgi:hypothetical protein